MSQWYVKELSQLTGVSVQTLHHYDRIDLLKPSLRLPNGYRVYNQHDLLTLQQIIALKFFGFELSHIAKLLVDEKDALAHFASQIQSLEAKANALLNASNVLKQVIQQGKDTQSIPWENIIKVIEVYRMSEQLEPWLKDIFTPEELKEYATFEAEWKANSTPAQKNHFEQNWAALVTKINDNLAQDPLSAIGVEVGKTCMELINGVYGKKYAHLRTRKFEKGFGEGKGLNEVGLTKESVDWLDKAVDAYWQDRVLTVLSQIETGVADETILSQWNTILDDLYGDEESRKKKFYNLVLNHAEVTPKMKEWLIALQKLVERNNYLS